MKGKFEKKRLSVRKFRHLLLAFLVLFVFAACFLGVMHGFKLHAATSEIITRGVLDGLDQLPAAKKTKNPKAELGTPENPFLILEIVPYEEYAEFGYHIGGCEPVDVENMFGRGDITSIGSFGAATVTPRGGSYFFPDEPEGNPENYDNPPVSVDWVYGAKYKGYYERVQEGTGSFVQKEDGTLQKKKNGNIIWHTINWYEEEDYADESFADDNRELLKEIGDRIYTTREHTQEDTVNVVYGYYVYKNNEDFLTDTLGLSKEEAENYSIVIKTITPDELNQNPDWVTYANLFSIAPKIHLGGLDEIWKKYNRLGHKSNTTNYNNTFYKNDISWEIAEKIYKRVTAKENYAAMVMDDNTYDGLLNTEYDSTKKVTFDILDWNLKPTGRTYDNSFGSNNNMYKLSVMLLCMDSDLFRQLYMSGDNPVIQDGINTLQSGDAAEYWSSYSFLLSDPNGDAWESNPYAYWESEESWENYGTSGNITKGENKPWVNHHIYTYPGNNSITQDFLSEGGAVTNEKFQEFSDYMENYREKNDKPDNYKPTPSNAIRYILGIGVTEAARDETKGTLKILDIEPCVDVAKGFSLTETYIRLMLPKFKGNIKIKHMTTAEFIGNAEDLNSNYNMIFLGLDYGAYNTAKRTISVQSGDSNGITWIKKELPDWNDSTMDGKIYVHTGDFMTSAEYVKTSKGTLKQNRSVQFLWSAITNSEVNSTKLRFPGNDITTLKMAELVDFANAGYPVVAVPYLYNMETAMIDQNSNICKFVKKNKKSGIYSSSDAAGIMKAISVAKPEVSFTKLPESYNGETDSNDKIANPNYLPKNSAGQSLLQFEFEVEDSENDKYAYRVYVDQNQDGKFASEEVLYYGSQFTANSGVQKYTCKLSSLLVGVVQWKIEVYQVENESIRFVQSGCSAARNTTGSKKEINVLQIMPKSDSESYDGKLNLATNELFKKYYNALDDYEVNVTAVSLDEFEGWFSEKNEGKKFSFNSSQDVSYEDTNPNPVNYTATLQAKFKDYNMLIFGFGDSYGSQNISNAYGAVDYIKYYIAEGKGVLFTHDMSSMYNTFSTDFGYTVNTLMRDVMGMNRYAAVSRNLIGEDRSELMDYQKKKSYDTVIDQNGNLLEQTQGFTYYAMKRLGWSDSAGAMTVTEKIPYQYMIHNPDGDAVCSKGTAAATGFNNNNDYSTRVGQMNEGQITEYPYKIDEDFEIATTHGQWYQLNMEDPEVTVWYTLLDDGKYDKDSDKDSNGHGTAATYGVSPYDAANNYYIYSKGNVFYSGVGHTTVDGDMEAKLFINTMIAAYRSAYESPMVEVLNQEAELINATDITYQIPVAQEFDVDVSAVGGENQVVAEEFAEEDMIKVTFSPVELNAVSTKLDCSLYYVDTSSGTTQKHYIDTIYDADDDKKIKAKEHVFEDVKHMHEYYFYYPKKYLNERTDEAGTQHPALRQMQFKIMSDRVKQPGYTTLNMSVQCLFQLD